MPFITFKDESRKNYGCTTQEGNGVGVDKLVAGSLMRIAEATEAMAKSHIQLIEERDRYERWYKQQAAEVYRLSNSNRALRGHMKRLKAKKP